MPRQAHDPLVRRAAEPRWRRRRWGEIAAADRDVAAADTEWLARPVPALQHDHAMGTAVEVSGNAQPGGAAADDAHIRIDPRSVRELTDVDQDPRILSGSVMGWPIEVFRVAHSDPVTMAATG
jgi:hypothetical protein